MTNLEIFSNYRFFSIRDPSEDTLRKFQVEKLPEVVGLFRELKEDEDPEDEVKAESVRLAIYKEKMEYNTLKEFLLIV